MSASSSSSSSSRRWRSLLTWRRLSDSLQVKFDARDLLIYLSDWTQKHVTPSDKRRSYEYKNVHGRTFNPGDHQQDQQQQHEDSVQDVSHHPPQTCNHPQVLFHDLTPSLTSHITRRTCPWRRSVACMARAAVRWPKLVILWIHSDRFFWKKDVWFNIIWQ